MPACNASMRWPASFARGRCFGDFAAVAIEQRQREVDIERPFRDAVIPVIAGLEFELRILARDRTLEFCFGLRIVTDRDGEIGARQQRLFARGLQTILGEWRRITPVGPVDCDVFERGGRHAERGRDCRLRVDRIGARVRLLLLDVDRDRLRRVEIGRRILAGVDALLLQRDEPILRSGEPRQDVQSVPRALAIGQARRSAHGARSRCAPSARRARRRCRACASATSMARRHAAAAGNRS